MISVMEKLGLKKKIQDAEAEKTTRAELIDEIRECENMLQKNEFLFNLEIDEDMIEAYIYEREALMRRHRALVRQAKSGCICNAAAE